jgi:hypothetical protein
MDFKTMLEQRKKSVSDSLASIEDQQCKLQRATEKLARRADKRLAELASISQLLEKLEHDAQQETR